jgi:uncharacterized membrane protein
MSWDAQSLRRRVSARTRILTCAAAGVAGGLVTLQVTHHDFAPLLGWDASAAVFLVWVWAEVWRLDGDATAALAEYEDHTRAGSDLLALAAAVASLLAVGVVLAGAAHIRGSAQDVRVSIGLASIVLSWAVVHTVFTLRYARLYYEGHDGGVDFPGERRPAYRDFAYLAFTIGMTFQVSDTSLETREIRTTAMWHGLLSFMFATGIVATSINLVASLSSQ